MHVTGGVRRGANRRRIEGRLDAATDAKAPFMTVGYHRDDAPRVVTERGVSLAAVKRCCARGCLQGTLSLAHARLRASCNCRLCACVEPWCFACYASPSFPAADIVGGTHVWRCSWRGRIGEQVMSVSSYTLHACCTRHPGSALHNFCLAVATSSMQLRSVAVEHVGYRIHLSSSKPRTIAVEHGNRYCFVFLLPTHTQPWPTSSLACKDISPGNIFTTCETCS